MTTATGYDELVRPACDIAEADQPVMGLGPCSFPGCSAGGGGRHCTGFTGQADDCLNCGHGYSYHA